MGNFCNFTKRAGALFLSATMLSTLITPDMAVYAAEEDSAAAAEPVQNITSGQGEDTRYWNLSWSDEFSNGALDTSKWSYMVGTGAEYSGNGWGNNEQEYYTDGENVSFVTSDDGNGGSADCLEITAKKTTDENKAQYGGKAYTSARLWTMDDSANPGGTKTTKYAKKYGRVEARIRIDGGGTGLWPAFWMMPEDDVYGTWAASGELDIMEARGSNTGAVDGTIHYGSQWPNNKSIGGHYSSDLAGYDENFTTQEWHTYAVEWLPGEIRWYMDNQLFYKTSNWYSTTDSNAANFTYPAPFDQNFYILLNLAVGGNYDGGALDTSWDSANMLVDYVRVYDLADSSYQTVAYDENVAAPEQEADDHLVSGTINETNYAGSDLSSYKKTTSYPDEADRSSWFVSELENGAANVTMDSDALKVNVTNGGNQNYSVQLIHNVPLTKGYRYVMTFKAKADTAKTITSKFGNIGGYPAYSDTYNVDLTTGWKEYTYVFDMASATDADGRIEFNMGQTTGACYFKDFSIISTGKTPKQDPDAAKTPLSDGNHIYNGTFDQGTGRTGYWNAFENTTMSVDSSVRELEIAGTADTSGVFQRGMNLLQSDSYQLTFDAKGPASGNITVKLLSKDMQTVYDETAVSIGTEYPSDAYSVTLQMPEGQSDTEGVAAFVTGNQTVYLDNVRMIRTTNNNLDWSAIDMWPLYNYDFYNGKDGWNIWSETGGWISSETSGDGLSVVTNVESGANFWCAGIQTSAMKFTGGVPYAITVNLNGNVAKKIKIETPDGTQTDYSFAAGTNQLVIPFIPSNDISGKVTLYLGVESGEYHFTLNSIEAGVDTGKLTVPDGYAKPGSVRSAGDVKAGNDFVIEHNDNTWASAITTAYVNDQAIDAALVDTSESGKIKINGSIIPDEGSYSIKFDAAGYTQTKNIVQKALSSDGNVIVNGKFTENADGWTNWFNGTGSLSVEDGQAVMKVTGNAGNNWDCQLKQSGIGLSASSYYVLSFEAYSDIERPLDLEFSGIGTASATRVNLTTEKKTYYITFSDVAATTSASILFMGGNVNGCLDDFASVGVHQIYFDNVVLAKATAEDVQNLTPAKLSLAAPAVYGKDVVLNYTENTVWEKKEITVWAGETQIAASAVSVNQNDNTITIDASAFTKKGTWSVAVQAAGYEKQTMTVNVIGSLENLAEGDWSVWSEGDEAGTFTTEDSAITLDFASTYVSQWDTAEFWSMQAKKSNICTEAGKTYQLSFDAELVYDDSSNTADRGLIVECGTQSDQHEFAIHKGKGSYTYTVTPEASDAFYLSFMLGATVKNVPAHTLKITNIRFKDASLTETEEPQVVNAAVPTILKQPVSASCSYGKTPGVLTVTAQSSDKGVLNYQWYQNSLASTKGASAISGATTSTYQPAKTAVGTSYYYCVIQNVNTAVNGNKTASCNSSIVSLTVKKASNAISGVSTGYTKTYGDQAFTLKAKGTGNITYVSSDTKVVKIGKTTGKVTIAGYGKATVKIVAAGNGNYQSGSKSITITVKPGKEKTTSLKSAKSSYMTVKWAKDSRATGYQIEYSTNKNFKSSKVVSVGKNTTVSKSIKSLKAGKKYYVRVRAYKTSQNAKIYGSWSTVKTVTVKK